MAATPTTHRPTTNDQRQSAVERYRPKHHVRIVTAASLFDGHDAAINIIRRILQAHGAEVIHLGHDRGVDEIVAAAVQEDADAIAVSSYQGGHDEFFHYLVDNPSCDPQTVSQFGPKDKARVGSCLVGNLDLPSTVRNGSPDNPAFRDKVRDWEALATIGAFTFYRGGSVIPFIGLAIDPVNHYGMEAFWSLDYYVTPNVAVNLAQRYFITPYGTSQPVFDPWGFQSLSSHRSETSVRLSYNF